MRRRWNRSQISKFISGLFLTALFIIILPFRNSTSFARQIMADFYPMLSYYIEDDGTGNVVDLTLNGWLKSIFESSSTSFLAGTQYVVGLQDTDDSSGLPLSEADNGSGSNAPAAAETTTAEVTKTETTTAETGSGEATAADTTPSDAANTETTPAETTPADTTAAPETEAADGSLESATSEFSSEQEVPSGTEAEQTQADETAETKVLTTKVVSSETTAETSAAAGESPEAADSSAIIEVASQIVGIEYSLEQLIDFDYLKNNFYYVHSSTTIYPEQLDANLLLSMDLSLKEDNSEPQILIYHTHYSEMYADSPEDDLSTGVIGVGNYLTQILTEQFGYNVIHDTTPYKYNDSYTLAGERLNEILAQYPSIQIVIDIHRDSGERETVNINGKETAKIMFFNGLCQTAEGPLDYLDNPYLEECLAFSLQLKLQAEAYYPGLTRKNYLKAYQYNQHLRPRSLLVEVGTVNNTFEEAKNAAEPLADLLDKVLSP